MQVQARERHNMYHCFKKIITDFYSTYRKTTAQRVAEDAHLTPNTFFIFILYIFYSLFFYRSEQILEASHLTVAPLLCRQMSPSAPNPSKRPLPFLQYSKQILTTTPTTTITTTTTTTITTTTTTITTTTALNPAKHPCCMAKKVSSDKDSKEDSVHNDQDSMCNDCKGNWKLNLVKTSRRS